MVKRNWIKEIIEFVRNAMNEGLNVYSGEYNDNYQIRIIRNHSLNEAFDFSIYKDHIAISSPTGFIKIENTLSERDELSRRPDRVRHSGRGCARCACTRTRPRERCIRIRSAYCAGCRAGRARKREFPVAFQLRC